MNSLYINSSNKELKISYNNNDIFINDHIIPYHLNQTTNELILKCKNNYQLEFLFGNTISYTIISPYFCDSISFNKTSIYFDYPISDFLQNVTQNNKILKQNNCSSTISKKRLMRFLSKNDKKSQLAYVGDIIKVFEGDKVPITWKNLYVLPEHQRFKLKNSDIKFNIIDQPSHGILQFSNGNLANSFSYENLTENQIFYKHDGSQISKDSFDVQVELFKKDEEIFNYVDFTKNTLTIYIEVININDPPVLELANDKYSIIIPEKSCRLLTIDQLIIFDVDNSNDDVYVTLLEAQGVLIQTNLSITVTNFTLNQLINHQIYICDDKSDLNYRYIKLQAYDQLSNSSVLTLNCLIKKISFNELYNTGVLVSHKSHQTIYSNNLTYNINIKNVCELEYYIIDEPSFGVIECLQNIGEFGKCSKFEQKSIDQEKVRYKHEVDNRPLNDTFNFIVSCNNITSQPKTFSIKFVPLDIDIFNFKPFILNNTEQSYLERSNLVVMTKPQTFQPYELIYYIIEPPKFGILSRKINDKKNRRIGVSSNFTQEHINENLIQYKLHFVQYSVVNDYFIFKVLTPTKVSEIKRFDIIYIPSGNSVQLINRIISVKTFSKQPILKTSLWLETSDDNDFSFTILIPPMFGKILKNDNTKDLIKLEKNNSFNSEDIVNGKLYYKHDGFDNLKDNVYLIARSIYKENSIIPFWVTFHMIETENLSFILNHDAYEIQLPINNEKILHPWMFLKKNTSKLQFKILTKMENFKIVSNFDRKKIVSSFNNNDLEKRNLLIKHFGSKFNEIVKISVNNGFLNKTINVRISAKQPSLEIIKNIIKYNINTNDNFNLISRDSLQSNCNLNIDLYEIQYNILEKYEFYRLENGQLNEILTFSQMDINDNKIFFKLSKWPSKITVEVVCRNIKKLSDIHFEENGNITNFVISNISPLNVSFASIETITTDVISVTPINDEDKIVYEIIEFPKHGNILIDIENFSKSSKFYKESVNQISSSIQSRMEIKKFTQENLKFKNIFYVNNGVDENIINDYFYVMIHKKMSSFGPFKLIINIKHSNIKKLSINLYLQWNLKNSMQEILQSYYHLSEENNVIFKIIKQPSIGKILKEKLLTEQNEFVNEFYNDELEKNEIFYSTEKNDKIKNKDKFIVRICSVNSGKCELDLEFIITINSFDIKTIDLLKNERLIVWSNNEPFTITKNHLFVQDDNKPSENIVYSITKVVNGFVSLKSNILKPIKYFTQNDINSNIIQFTLTQDSTGGFAFTISNSINRIEPEWFTVEKMIKNNIIFENNAKLFTYPLGKEFITTNLLKVAYLNSSNENIIYHISKQPKYGNILLNGKITNLFTQSDLINKNVIFQSTNKYQKYWTIKDYFLFNISINNKVSSGVEKFRITITYALIQQDNQNLFIPTSKMYVSANGASILTQSILNMTDIIKYLSKEKLALEIWKPPKFGVIKFFKGNDKIDKIIGDQILHLDKYIYYENNQNNQKVDNTWFSLCPEKECHKKRSRMKIHLPIEIISPMMKEIQFENFDEIIYVDETGIKILNNQIIKVTHLFLSSSNLYFTVDKLTKNTTHIFVENKKSTKFSQNDIDKGIVSIRKSLNFTESSDLIQINIGGHNRVLKIIYQSIKLEVTNNSNIQYYQGKTYVILNQTHLNVQKNANRDKIIYNITKIPNNGTFYRVDGDKEVLTFSQENIDNGEILYAQVNMNAFQDYFEFSIFYDGNEIVKSNSKITIIPTISYKPFTLEGGTMSNIDIKYINATTISELSPRFYVIINPNYGKLILNGITPLNESIKFFTFTDIIEHRLFYDAIDTKKPLVDNIQIELRGDSIQPARFNFTVHITPTLLGSHEIDTTMKKKLYENDIKIAKPSIPKIQSDNESNNLSVILAVCIVVIIICVLFCKRSSSKKKESQPQLHQLNDDQNPNLYRSLEVLQLSKQLNKNTIHHKIPTTNLLENTVYAKVGEQKILDSTTMSPRNNRKTPTKFESSKESLKPNILQTFETPRSINKYNISSSRLVSFPSKEIAQIHKTESETNFHSRKQQGNTTLKKDQYWV
ncbi:Chondroitin sulfate proteoglycan 4 [Strongyloides ratti]|uniref:Chondroitin sulfate proteoglycan 4 n=1 Tax=Strongyloides ratti TaxID=34506 RepID=A0A090MXJ2_STRRB|nr:Chondroitin sulfate proteoglycan 4 [Strongyloides ratti]CEF65529.1 Chondroitin sulfate proteoglycan 4 [Strongyloides ratti]